MTIPESNGPAEGPIAPTHDGFSIHRVSRRTFLGGTLSVAIPLLAVGRDVDHHHAHAHAQSTDAATPTAATPVASPGASPVASPQPVSIIGQLNVVEDQRPVESTAPVAGGDLKLYLTMGENGNYNAAAYLQDFQITASYLDPLVWIDEVTMEPLPWLAASWKWSKKNTRITYTLRDGVTWHDGSKLDAKDVAFSFFVYRDDVDSAVANIFVNMVNAEATDSNTVVVDLSQPDGNWLLNASSQFILQRKQYIKHWRTQTQGQGTLSDFDWKKSAPVGTGPWKLAKHDNSQISFERNESYFAGPPHAETLTLTVQPDSAARIEGWAKGEVDLLWTSNFADVTAASATPGRVYIADTASVMFAAFNFNNPNRSNPTLFADRNLRNALSKAIDRGKYAASVFGSFAFPDRAGTVAQPWAYDVGSVNLPFDIAGAKEMLDNAGYKDTDGDGILESSDGERLDLRTIVRLDAKPELLAVLASAADDLKQIGVRLNVRALSPQRFASEWIDTHNFDLIAYAYDLYPGFTDFDLYGSAWDIRQNPQGWNPGGYTNPVVDRLIRRILVEPQLDDQTEDLHALQEAVNTDLFGLWFGFPREYVLARPDVKGFQPNKLWQTWGTRALWRG